MIHKTTLRKSFESEAFPHLDAIWQTSLWLTENEDSALRLVKETFVNAFRFQGHSTSESNCRLLLFKTMGRLFFKDSGQKSLPPQEFATDDSDQTFFYDKLALMKAIPSHIVNMAISGLLAEIRFVTLLSMLWGFSHNEIAEIAGIEKGVVQTRLYWGRRLIRREFFKYMKLNANIGREELIL